MIRKKPMHSLIRFAHKILENQYIYDAYQTFVGGTKYREKIILDAINEFNPKTILDLGCGPGGTLKILPDAIYYLGIDISANYLKLAEKKLKNGKLIFGDVTLSRNYSNLGKIDLILAMGLFHHLNDEQLTKVILNIKDLLDNGARLFSTDPTITEHTDRFAKWFANNDRGEYVRSPKALEKFFLKLNMEVKSIVKSEQFRIPLDSIELKI